MATPIQIEFSIGGIARVREAFDSVAKAQQKLERSMVASAANESRVRGASAKASERWMDAYAAKQQRILDKGVKDSSKAEEAKFRSRADGEKRSLDLQLNSAKMAGQIAAQSVRDFQKAETNKVRARELSEKQSLAIQLRSAKESGRIAEQSVRAEAALRKRFTGSVPGQVVGSIRGTLGMVGRVGGSIAALGGGFSVADAVAGSMSAEKAAIALSVSSYLPGKTERPDKKRIMDRARSVESSTNISKKELIQGWQSYVAKTGDYDSGEKNLGFFAQLSKSQGANFGDVMSTAGMIRTQNKTITPEAMRSTMRNIVGQGRTGAVELSDLAHVAGKITASSAEYGEDQTVTQGKLLGLAQIAIKSTGSAEEAGTVVARLSGDALGHRDSMPKGTFDGQGRIKSANGLISSVFESSGGNLGKIMDMGFNKESVKLFEALAPTFNDAEKIKKGSGLAAVNSEVAGFTSATYSDKDVEKDFAAVMASNGEKLDTAFTHIRDVLEQKLTPYIEKFSKELPELMPKIERVIDAFGTLSEYIVDNPLKGLGAVVMAKVSADLINAGIGKAAAFAIEKAVGSTFASAVIPVAAMAVTAAAVTIWAQEDTGRQKADAAGVAGGDTTARDVLAGVAAGTATPAEVAKAKAKAEGDLNEAKVRRERLVKNGGEDAMGEAIYTAGHWNPVTSKDTDDAWRTRVGALNTTISGLQMNLDILNKAFITMGKTAGGVPPVANSPVSEPARVVAPTHPARN